AFGVRSEAQGNPRRDVTPTPPIRARLDCFAAPAMTRRVLNPDPGRPPPSHPSAPFAHASSRPQQVAVRQVGGIVAQELGLAARRFLDDRIRTTDLAAASLREG